MKKEKILKFYRRNVIFLLIILTILSLAGCGNKLSSILDGFHFEFANSEDSISSVTDGFKILNKYDGNDYKVIFSSDDETISIDNNNFEITRGNEDKQVTINALISYRNQTEKKEFKIIVKGYPYYKVTILDPSVISLKNSDIDLEKVNKDTELTFTVKVPSDKKITSLLVNNTDYTNSISNLKFSVKVTANIVIQIILAELNEESIGGASIFKENDYQGYYTELIGSENTTPTNLIVQLRQRLTKGYVAHPYSYAKRIGLFDEKIDEPNYVWSIYDNKTYKGLSWPNRGIPWNREHVWACAWLGEGTRPKETHKGKSSDLHNLRACTNTENSSRNNRFFKNDSNATQIGHTTEESYYPGNLFKGDVARILMYMSVRWADIKLICQEKQFPSTVDGKKTAYNPNFAKIGDLKTLLKWHLEDPVDEFEKRRNQRIYEVQKNRNPFIDYPELFKPIWKEFMKDNGVNDFSSFSYLKENQPETKHLVINFNKIINEGTLLQF